VGERRLNCANGFRGIGTLGGGVSSVLDGMMDVTVIQRLPLSRDCPKIADSWKQNCFLVQVDFDKRDRRIG
jgi:hypothetical protein